MKRSAIINRLRVRVEPREMAPAEIKMAQPSGEGTVAPLVGEQWEKPLNHDPGWFCSQKAMMRLSAETISRSAGSGTMMRSRRPLVSSVMRINWPR